MAQYRKNQDIYNAVYIKKTINKYNFYDKLQSDLNILRTFTGLLLQLQALLVFKHSLTNEEAEFLTSNKEREEEVEGIFSLVHKILDKILEGHVN